jgi:hypothetical protein
MGLRVGLEKSLPLGFDPQTVYPTASHYTDNTFLAIFICKYKHGIKSVSITACYICLGHKKEFYTQKKV